MTWLSIPQRLGVNADDPKYLQRKTVLTNQFALMLTGLFAFYLLVAASMLPSLVLGFLAGMFIFASVLLLNFIQLHTLARFFLSSGFSLACFLLHVSVISSSQEVLPGYIALQVAAIVLPWVLFDTREPFSLWTASLFSLLCLLSVHTAYDWITSEISLSVEEKQSVDFYLMLSSALVIVFGLYLLQASYQASEKDTQSLLDEMHQSELLAKENEEKMNKYIAEIEQTREEDRKRQWASDGLAKFTDLIRRQDNIKQLGDDIISQLVRYLNANQGGLFVLKDDGHAPYLELVSCYAYNRKKYVDKTVAIGEGLIGQVYLEKERIYMTDVPENYLRITSGLGEANPRCVLIVPLIINEVVLGVMEIASFNKFEPYQLEFIDKLSESIASVISNARVNETTRKLLEESQQQAEEMRAQEEEMRQNMEELQATQEEMMRKQQENLRLLEEAQARELQLSQKTKEIEKLKDEERVRMDAMKESQQKLIKQVMEKGKKKEEELLAKLKEKEDLINQLQINSTNNNS